MATTASTPAAATPDWETTVFESVGRVIEFWGFKRNHGRVWALLYLQNEPMAAVAIQRQLGLSKGAVSIIVHELQAWTIIRRVPVSSRSGVAYVAQSDMWRMIETVLRQRELRLVEEVQSDLTRAKRLAERDPSLDLQQRRQMGRRINNLRLVARAGQVAIDMLIRSRRTNLASLRTVLSRRG